MSESLGCHCNNDLSSEAQMNLEGKFQELSKEQKLVLASCLLTEIIDDSKLAETKLVMEFYNTACSESDSDILAIAKWLINSI